MDEDDDFDDFEEATYAPAPSDTEAAPQPQVTQQAVTELTPPTFDLNALSSSAVGSLTASNHLSTVTNQDSAAYSFPSQLSQPQITLDSVPQVPSLTHHQSTPAANQAGSGMNWGGDALGGLDWSTAATGVKTETQVSSNIESTFKSQIKTEQNQGTFEWGVMGSTNSEPINLDYTGPSISKQSNNEQPALNFEMNHQTSMPIAQPISVTPAIQATPIVDNDQPQIWEDDSPTGQPVPYQEQIQVEQAPIQSEDTAEVQDIFHGSIPQQPLVEQPEAKQDHSERKDSDDFEFQTAVQPDAITQSATEPTEPLPQPQPINPIQVTSSPLDFDFLGQPQSSQTEQPPQVAQHSPAEDNNFEFVPGVENSQLRKESDDFEFQEAPPVLEQAPQQANTQEQFTEGIVTEKLPQPAPIFKQIESEEVEWDFGPISPAQPVIRNVQQQTKPNLDLGPLVQQNSSVPVEVEPQVVATEIQPQVEPSSTAQAQQDEDDQFGQFEQVVPQVPNNTVEQPPPPSPVPPPLPDNPDNTVHIPPHILEASPDLHQQKVHLQKLVDRLPDYSFLMAEAFLTLP